MKLEIVHGEVELGRNGKAIVLRAQGNHDEYLSTPALLRPGEARDVAEELLVLVARMEEDEVDRG